MQLAHHYMADDYIVRLNGLLQEGCDNHPHFQLIFINTLCRVLELLSPRCSVARANQYCQRSSCFVKPTYYQLHELNFPMH